MNIIIKNQNSKLLSELQVDVLKTFEGEFSKSEIQEEFVNLYYNKVIIDITAIKNYYDFSSLFDFLSFFETKKIVILLNDSDFVNSKSYLSKLVERGYYNFTRNVSAISYLINNPNTLEDVSKYIEESSLNPTVNYVIEENNQEEKKNFVDKIVEDTIKTDGPEFDSGKIVIGINNITPHAGATTLMYMLVKQLNVSNKAKGIEMLYQDSMFFKDNNLTSASSLEDLKMIIKTIDADVVVVDLNGLDGSTICHHILYLIEPGIIKLNKLLKGNQEFREKIKNGKVILNRSAIKNEDISNFEYETKINVFFNLTNFNERKDRIQIIDDLIIKLNLKAEKPQRGFLGLFK